MDIRVLPGLSLSSQLGRSHGDGIWRNGPTRSIYFKPTRYALGTSAHRYLSSDVFSHGKQLVKDAPLSFLSGTKWRSAILKSREILVGSYSLYATTPAGYR